MRVTIVSLIALFCLVAPSWAELPYSEHGLSAHEAAVHLLDRFSLGAEPGQVDRVVEMGLGSWLEQQLGGRFANGELERRLKRLPLAYRLSNRELVEKYPDPGMVRRMAREEGLIDENGRPLRPEVRKLMAERGLRPYGELGVALFGQKLLHARYNENGLQEVMTEFWFNHFNVALNNNRARSFILSYERDVVRPLALAPFGELLQATAKHPAMLFYLDNALSTASADAMTTAEAELENAGLAPQRAERLRERLKRRKKGVNENYARELLELHTLGVDGGYTQKDVEEIARAFTGWTALGPRRMATMDRMVERGRRFGVQAEGDFVFAAPLHDAGAKTILGRAYPAGVGLEEGEAVLRQLVAHPGTARHLARKFAVRFVSDHPSTELVEELAAAFQRSGGDTRVLLRTIASSSEFWNSRVAKVKSPFELLISSARALDADLQPTRELYGWLVKMGQPLYNYQAPTGFPDRADFWVSSGTVLSRVNFGLQAGTGKIEGFVYRPRSFPDLERVVAALLPAQDAKKVSAKLKPLSSQVSELTEEDPKREGRRFLLGMRRGKRMSLSEGERDVAALIGLVLGSPEFQRR